MPHRHMSASAPRTRRIAVTLAALCLCAHALAQPQPSTQRITPNFKDADITQIIEAVSMATGKNFIIDPRVRAQVTMLSSTPMTPDQFYQAFLAILQVHGFVAVPSGNVTKIIPDANMRQYPSVDLPNSVSSSSDEVVTQVMEVHNVNASTLVPILRTLMPQNAQLSAVGANMLVMSDRANNVNRMMRIIERIDQVGNSDIDVIPLQNATAIDTARTLNSLMAQTGEAGNNLKIVADDRSNSILISGDEAQRLRARTLVTHLDTPIDTGSETQVRYLRYSDATDLATRLKEQLSGSSSSSTSSSTSNRNANQPVPNAQGNTGPLPGATAAPAASSGGAAQLSLAGGIATVWADKDTNALVITAGQRTMRAVNQVIDKLDIRRPQVLVQAIIADVATDTTDDLGVNWAIDGSNSSVGVGGFISAVGGTSAVDLYNDYASSSLTTSALQGTTLGIGRLKAAGVNFAAMLRALQGDSRTNIIGHPSIVTRDNQEAKIEVAQEVPFLTGQYTTTNGTGSAFQTIQEQDVGTILTVTPTINDGDVILLKLDVENSSLSSTSGVGDNPITNKNTITTNVLIKDGGTLVLGGLIQDSVTNNEQTVPLLGKIPLIGELFRTRNNEKTKSDFLIFLQPRILRDDDQAALETDSKYNYIRSEQQKAGHDKTKLPLDPYMPSDPLPTIKNGEIQDDNGPFGLGPRSLNKTNVAPGVNTATGAVSAPAPESTATPAPAVPGSTPSATPLQPAGGTQ